MALIIDTGPLVAFLDRSDEHHVECRALIEQASERRLVPEPVLVEVDYWAHVRLGAAAFVAFLDDVIAGAFDVEPVTADDRTRIRELIAKYADADIGYVDAAVIALCERLGEKKVASLDRRHFGLVRPRHVKALELLPSRPPRVRRSR